MFGLFSQKQPQCPVDEQTRLWMEHAFLWLTQQFGEAVVQKKGVILPNSNFFHVIYDGTIEPLHKTAAIVAKQMDIDIDVIDLHVYDQNANRAIFTVGEDGQGLAAGAYSKNENTGRYDIFIEKTFLTRKPEEILALLAHELAHIKLLGEKRLEDNDEHLTELTTVLFRSVTA
ncbi:MAG TPA: hypothetical protein VHB48_15185 [Chitinophagaceae bacterium]|nr:hypothetical protein [Chitinophagaceae bacterium]